MMEFLAVILAVINKGMNFLGQFLFAPLISSAPGWVSNTVISAVTGVVLLVIFKYTSNQTAIGRVRDGIKANMLALKLYKDSMAVTFGSLGRVFRCTGLLLLHSLKPMLVMIVPVVLIVTQLSVWYQASPLGVGQEALVTVQMQETAGDGSGVKLAGEGFEILLGPVRAQSKGQVFWKIRGAESGYHELLFETGGVEIEKELAVGEGFMRVSKVRSGPDAAKVLLNPAEEMLDGNQMIKRIEIEYPERAGWVSGTNKWIWYFFIASMVFAFIFKPFLKVKM